MSTLPSDFKTLMNNGNSLLGSGEYVKAEAMFLEATNKFPESPHPFIGLARSAQYKNNYTLSLERWKIALDNFPGNTQILIGLGNIYLDLKDFEKANRYFSEANDLELGLFNELNELVENGYALMHAEEFAKAESEFINAQSKWPNSLKPFYAHHRLLEIKRRKLMKQ